MSLQGTMEGPPVESTGHKPPTTTEASGMRVSIGVGIGVGDMPATRKDTAVGSDEVHHDESMCSSDEEDEGWYQSFVPPDGGYGWVVCFTSFWTNAIIFGTINTFAVFYVHIVKAYATGDVPMSFKIALVGSVQVAATFLFAPLASIVEDQIGLRGTAVLGSIIAAAGMLGSSYTSSAELLIVTYGFIVGFGFAFIYTPSAIILGHYFERHLGLANGIVQAGSSLAVIAMPFTLQGVIEEIGVKNSFKLLSGSIVLLGLCALAWKPIYYHPDYHWRLLSGWKRVAYIYMDAHIWRHRSYPRWVLALTVAFLGYMVPFVHIVRHATETVPHTNTIVLIMCLGAASGVSRLLSGEVADLPFMSRIIMQQVALFLMGVAIIAIPHATSFSGIIGIVMVLGFCDGCVVSLIMPIVYDLVGPHGAPQGIGTQMGLCALPMLAGPPLAALMYDYKGNYNMAFTLAGIPPIIGAFIMTFVPRKNHVHIRNSLVPEPEAVASSVYSISNYTNSKQSGQDCVSAGDLSAVTEETMQPKRGSSNRMSVLTRLNNRVEPGPAPVYS